MRAAQVRRESCAAAPGSGRLRILYASDLHLGLPWTRRVRDELVLAADAARPDVVLLGGDLIDHARGLETLEECVDALAKRRPVGAVPGNHDVRAGVEAVRDRALGGGATWLPDEPLVVETGGRPVRLTGAGAPPAADSFNVACLHDPADAAPASRAGFDLAFAGHLHGGQCVFFQRRDRLYPGAWFNRWTGLRFHVGGLRLFVSRGLGDTLPLRFNCPRELIVCDVGA
jgi:predicted MPP superfamily phosphohydrolase